ncbi:thiolase domain-containing protein [Carboxydothermus pertinax]|uniref:propanoyl-CoA C-acyltransferase n=1 Tax=Carboxydothermus pertinax TaxID=870242 RepID=A0A1L8CST5_9THEO|nr:thiolase domain-containing protein [Carboxydothermus pertinax]GAV21981.1 acetyl-CoA acetyltransferase [Carboxydothermus pertinax]
MRPVYMVAGGITKFKKANPDKDFRYMVKEAFDYAMNDIPKLDREQIDATVASYFSDHFTRQLMAGIMVQDYLGLVPKMSKRIEGGGATGGLCFQTAWETIASGRAEVCVAYGFETMSHVNTWKGNEFIAHASDTNFDYPVGGFYTGYYALMARRHMYEFGTTEQQLAMVSVKNHKNAIYNPYSQFPAELTIEDVLKSEMVADPLKRLDICVMSDGAAVAILASEEMAYKLTDKPVKITGIGTGTDTMRLADRPSGKVILLPHEKEDDYKDLKYPGVHSFRGGRMAALQAYKMAGITDPLKELDFVELHDAYTSSEIQTYEDLGLCKYGEGGKFVESGYAELNGKVPVNPSGGLLACGHPVGATGLMQAVFAFWQLQGTIGKHFGNDKLQIKNAKRGLIHSHAGTGTYITVSILERGF